jgi:hypothetical protein
MACQTATLLPARNIAAATIAATSFALAACIMFKAPCARAMVWVETGNGKPHWMRRRTRRFDAAFGAAGAPDCSNLAGAMTKRETARYFGDRVPARVEYLPRRME